MEVWGPNHRAGPGQSSPGTPDTIIEVDYEGLAEHQEEVEQVRLYEGGKEKGSHQA